jgi:hypothetical protein
MSQLQVNRINDASGGVLAPISSVMRNRIINGAMVIDQRNAGASITNAAGIQQYPVDRFFTFGTVVSKFTAQQNAGSVTPPAGFTNYLGITSLSAYSSGASEVFGIAHYVEGLNTADLGWGTANAKTVTLSFWVRSSLTGTFGGSLMNGAQNRSYPFTYTISAANTWEQKSITIAGDTTGTWLTTNGTGIQVWLNIGSGSSVSGTAGAWAAGVFVSATGATSVVGTNGATLYITGVQLEVGTQATSFEYRQYTTELQLCQRYYWRASGSAGLGFAGFASGYANTTSQATVVSPIPTTMRAIPTTNFGGTLSVLPASTGTSVTSIAQSYTGNGTVWNVFGLSGANLTVGTGVVIYTQNASTNFFDASAEL